MKTDVDQGQEINSSNIRTLKNRFLTNMLIVIIGFLMGVCLTIVLILLISTLKNDTQFSTIVEDENHEITTPIVILTENNLSSSKTPRIISRSEWLALPPTAKLNDQKLPVHKVIIAHTDTNSCTNKRSCTFGVRTIQSFHMESKHWSDIGINFLVGGDNSIYEGRGWNKIGVHSKGYNTDSVCMSFIGNFTDKLPPEGQLSAAKQLIELGISLGKIDRDYKLYGHRQFIRSSSPGDALFAEIQTWPHFDGKKFL